MGRMTDQKSREAFYQRYSSEILREGLDPGRLTRVAARVMCAREVASDSILGAMLRGVIATREGELRAQTEATCAANQTEHAREATQRFSAEFFTKEQVRGMLQRLQLRFDDAVAHYAETAATEMLKQIEELARRYSVHVDQAVVQHYRDAFEACRQRCANWRKAVEQLAEQGIAAGCAGDEVKANWIIRRLGAIHALRGEVLNEAHLQELVCRIRAAEDDCEEQEAAQALRQREQEIALEVKQLALAVRKFHEVAQSHTPDSPAFRVAAERYRKAIEDVQHHDQEWLTGIFMELEDLVAGVHDTGGTVEGELDLFIERVRRTLVHMRQEIRQIHAEKLDQFLTPPAPGG